MGLTVGIGLGMSFNGGIISGAQRLLAAETNGIAGSFMDNSLSIRDTVTPANAFSGAPFSKLTFTRASICWYFDSTGVLVSATTDVPRIDYGLSSTTCKGLLIEEARTNVVLHNRDLTNVAWTSSNVTAAKDQTGIDGSANSASSLTATAGNGTCLQAITLASSARFQSAYVKRITGSGVVNMTLDNGATWTAITVTAAWTRVTIPTQTLANPTVGFQIVTSGDAIAVDCVQNENGTFATSPIIVTTAAVTRAADICSIANTLFNLSQSAGTLYAKSIPQSGSSSFTMIMAATDATITNEFHGIERAALAAWGFTFDGAVQQAAPTSGAGSWSIGTVAKIAYAYALNDFSLVKDGGAAATDSAGTLPTTNKLTIGANGGGTQIFTGWISEFMYLPRRMANADMQALTT